jgi:hypothetical protein
LKVKVRRVYNKRKLGDHYQEELKRLSKELLVAKRKARETFLSSVLQNDGNWWAEFFKYVKRRKGNRENIPAIKGYNDNFITDPIEEANSCNSYYASVFNCERNNPQIQSTDQANPFNINIIRDYQQSGERNLPSQMVFLGVILKFGGEAMIQYLARWLEIRMNNRTIPGDWKKSYSGPYLQRGK